MRQEAQSVALAAIEWQEAIDGAPDNSMAIEGRPRASSVGLEQGFGRLTPDTRGADG